MAERLFSGCFPYGTRGTHGHDRSDVPRTPRGGARCHSRHDRAEDRGSRTRASLQERAAHVEANRIKDEFLATLSHELRTPLNAILGWISLIEGHALPPDKVPLALSTIARNARSIVELHGGTIDDQAGERALLAAMFEHAGTDVQSAGSVGEAFDLMGRWVPHLVVSDLAMPSEDGYVLIRRLRTTSPLQKIPALAVTAHARPEDREAALAAGYDAYISKPLDREALLARASMLLGRRRHASH